MSHSLVGGRLNERFSGADQRLHSREFVCHQLTKKRWRQADVCNLLANHQRGKFHGVGSLILKGNHILGTIIQRTYQRSDGGVEVDTGKKHQHTVAANTKQFGTGQ